MEPRIQYAKTEDGVNIAYSVQGQGRPLLHLQGAVFGHLQLAWQIPHYHRWFEQLAKRWQLIRFDRRGTGLSDRGVTGHDLETYVDDMKAVLEAARIDKVALFATRFWGPLGITYAVRHPERVSHLILFGAFARGSDITENPKLAAARSLIDTNWEVFTETLTQVSFNWSSHEDARDIAKLMRAGVTPDEYKTVRQMVTAADVTELLPRVQTPTLVFHPRATRALAASVPKELVSSIPTAHMVMLEGESALPERGDSSAILAAVEDFFGETTTQPDAVSRPNTAETRTILFTDMASSTALAQQLGDAGAQEVRHAHNEIVRATLSSTAGSEIKHTGDGIMASFAAASSALDCAIAIQRGVAAHKAEHQGSPLAVYVGLNAGEPIAEDDDLFGTSINLAARICDHAEAGQIVASDVVRQLAAGKDFLFSDLGETELRGFEDPIKLWELRWRSDASP